MTNTYRTSQGDTWDVISLKNYDSELFSSDIMMANYQYRNTAIFGAGVVLTIPEISTTAAASTNLPPWRR